MRVKERNVAPTEKTQRHVGMLFPKEPKKVRHTQVRGWTQQGAQPRQLSWY